MAIKVQVRNTSDWEIAETAHTKAASITAMRNWVYARNNKNADTKWPLINAASWVLNYFLLHDPDGTPYIPSNRLAWLGTNIIRVSPIATCTPAQAVCLAHKDYFRAYEEQLGRPYEG